jgi:hypothetical protein
MKPSHILADFQLVASRKVALSTEQSYRVWISKFIEFCATLDGGENINRVAAAMGHTDVRTTAGYGRKECVEMRSPLDRIIQFSKLAS